MFCTQCGEKLTEGLKFCTSCGNPVPVAAAPPTPPPAPSEGAAPIERPVLPAAAPRPPVPVESMTAAGTEPDLLMPRQQSARPFGQVAIVVLVVACALAAYYFLNRGNDGPGTTPGGTANAATETAAAAPGEPTPAPSIAPSTAAPPFAPESRENPAEPGTAGNADRLDSAAPGSDLASASEAVEHLVGLAVSGDVGRLDSAIAEMESQAKPPSGDSPEGRQLNDRAVALMRAGSYAEAVPLLEQARRADASDVEIAGNLADALMRANRLDEAWQAAVLALTLAPRRTVGWSTLGLLLAKRDQQPSAVACFVTGYRFSNAQATTQQVYSRLAATDPDVKVRTALEEAVKLLGEPR